MSELACSVIIPSYNRRATLQMVLDGLALQTARVPFEVLVVLDGSTDDSEEMVRGFSASARLANLRTINQPNAGQAAARNAGAAVAAAPLLIFLDDDIVPEPGMLEAHLRRHAENGGRVAVLGDCHVAREHCESLYHLGVWAWWEDMYAQRALPGRKCGYRDFCSGNISIGRDEFLASGGFDTSFRGYGGEDYELGHRLLQRGVTFIAEPRARSVHYHRTTVDGVLKATRQEGHADVIMGTRHPSLRPGLRLMFTPPGALGHWATLAMKQTARGDLLAEKKKRLLPRYQKLRMRRRWLALFNNLRGFAYWRGVRDALSHDELMEYRKAAPDWPTLEIDITHGLPDNVHAMHVDGPSRLKVMFHGQEMGVIPIHRAVESPLKPFIADRVIDHCWHRIMLFHLARGENPWLKWRGNLVKGPPLSDDNMKCDAQADPPS